MPAPTPNSPWDFQSVFELVNNLDLRDSPAAKDGKPKVHHRKESIANRKTTGLGDFGPVWDFYGGQDISTLGKAVNITPISKQVSTSSTEASAEHTLPTYLGLPEPIKEETYTSDGAAYQSTAKIVSWKGLPPCFSDEASDSVSDLATPSRKSKQRPSSRKRRAQRAREQEAVRKTRSDVESESEIRILQRLSPAKKASVHSRPVTPQTVPVLTHRYPLRSRNVTPVVQNKSDENVETNHNASLESATLLKAASGRPQETSRDATIPPPAIPESNGITREHSEFKPYSDIHTVEPQASAHANTSNALLPSAVPPMSKKAAKKLQREMAQLQQAAVPPNQQAVPDYVSALATPKSTKGQVQPVSYSQISPLQHVPTTHIVHFPYFPGSQLPSVSYAHVHLQSIWHSLHPLDQAWYDQQQPNFIAQQTVITPQQHMAVLQQPHRSGRRGAQQHNPFLSAYAPPLDYLQQIQQQSLHSLTQMNSKITQPFSILPKEDRDLHLFLKLVYNFPEDKSALTRPVHLLGHSSSPSGIHVFIDFSNIWVSFMEHLKLLQLSSKQRIPHQNISFDSLVLLIERNRPVNKRVLAGSYPLVPAMELAKAIGYETNILDKVYKERDVPEKMRRTQVREALRRGYSAPTHSNLLPASIMGTGGGGVSPNGNTSGGSGICPTPVPAIGSTTPTPPAANNSAARLPITAATPSTSLVPDLVPEKWVEQCVDELLHLKMLESIVDTDEPSTMVVATGDAASAEYSAGFMKMILRALKKGWKVELVAWQKSISHEYMKNKEVINFTQAKRFRIIELDPYAEYLLDT